MVNWACTQCGENLEAPEGFSEVIECPKCGNHSRPPPVPVKAKPVEEKPKSHDKNKHGQHANGVVRKFHNGKVLIGMIAHCLRKCAVLKLNGGMVLIGVGIVMLWAGIAEDTKHADDSEMGIEIFGAAILVIGAIFATRKTSD